MHQEMRTMVSLVSIDFRFLPLQESLDDGSTTGGWSISFAGTAVGCVIGGPWLRVPRGVSFAPVPPEEACPCPPRRPLNRALPPLKFPRPQPEPPPGYGSDAGCGG